MLAPRARARAYRAHVAPALLCRTGRGLPPPPGRRTPSPRASWSTSTPSRSSSPWPSRPRPPTPASTRPPATLFPIADTPETDAGARRGGADPLHQDHRPLPQQGQERHPPVASILVEDYGGEVPSSRAALEALPGVGRKTANVVLNMWWGFPSQPVDTHVFRVGNRTGIALGPDVVAVERGAGEPRPRRVPAPLPPLADPARPLHLRRAQAQMPGLPDPRPLHLRGQDPHDRTATTSSASATPSSTCSARPTTPSSTSWGSRRASCSSSSATAPSSSTPPCASPGRRPAARSPTPSRAWATSASAPPSSAGSTTTRWAASTPHSLAAEGTDFPNPPVRDGGLPTSRSMIFVSPDGERSMNTYLGISSELGPEDVPEARGGPRRHPVPRGLPLRQAPTARRPSRPPRA